MKQVGFWSYVSSHGEESEYVRLEYFAAVGGGAMIRRTTERGCEEEGSTTEVEETPLAQGEWEDITLAGVPCGSRWGYAVQPRRVD